MASLTWDPSPERQKAHTIHSHRIHSLGIVDPTKVVLWVTNKKTTWNCPFLSSFEWVKWLRKTKGLASWVVCRKEWEKPFQLTLTTSCIYKYIYRYIHGFDDYDHCHVKGRSCLCYVCWSRAVLFVLHISKADWHFGSEFQRLQATARTGTRRSGVRLQCHDVWNKCTRELVPSGTGQ